MSDQEREALEVIAVLSDRRSTPEWDQVKDIARAALAAREPSERLSECCKAEARTGGGTGATHYYVCSVCEKACGLAARKEPEERCSYCGEFFPKPVELHHAETDCLASSRGSEVERLKGLLQPDARRSSHTEQGSRCLI